MKEKTYSLETATKDAIALFEKNYQRGSLKGVTLENENGSYLRIHVDGGAIFSLETLKRIGDYYGDEDPFVCYDKGDCGGCISLVNKNRYDGKEDDDE